MHTRQTHPRLTVSALAGLCALAAGCYHMADEIVPPPPDGSVPTEMNKVVLPPYVIEAPDILYVQVLIPPEQIYIPTPSERAAKAREGAKPGPMPQEELRPGGVGEPPINARQYFSGPVSPVPIEGSHIVQMDGTIDLGIYGSVRVAGMTRDQAREAVRAFILELTKRQPDQIQVRVTVQAYNSKLYYVITDGAGYGEQIQAFPITGSETVLDAIARIGGLPSVASKRDIWVSRRSPHGGPYQILPVCWEEITKQGITRTNYQVLPGDRIYVNSQKIIAADYWIAKVVQPVERIFGVILLGSETVHSVNGTTP